MVHCDSCTWSIFRNTASTEAGELGLTRGNCFVARRRELAAVAVLLCFSWRISSSAGYIHTRHIFVFVPANAHGLPLRHVSGSLASLTSLPVMRPLFAYHTVPNMSNTWMMLHLVNINSVGRSAWQILSCMVVVWRTHRGEVGASGLHGTE